MMQRISGWTSIINIQNYEFVMGGRYVLDDPVLVNNIQEADVIIYQPMGEQFGKNASSEILARARPSCQFIAIPYVFNHGFWPMVRVARSDIDPDDLAVNTLAFINLEPIINLLDQGHDLDHVIKLFESQQIDFNHADRFRRCQDYLINKEKQCDIKISDFINHNYQHTKLFFYPSHPTLYLLNHMASLIIDLIDCESQEQINEERVWQPSTMLPLWQGSIDELGLMYPADVGANDYYKSLIRNHGRHHVRQ